MIYIFFIARLIFGLYLLTNAYNHFKNHKSMASYASSMNVAHPKWAVLGSGALLLIGGLGILLWVLVPVAVLAIILFLIPVSLKMHAYWKESDPMAKMNQKIQFQKNMAILAGALAFLLI
ncbi:DoxX family membrane protein [Candidatus Nomurabacteria bacterium]|nr:DoxX family membrane protein [Candidatus Nomurabacteria bacterium]